MLYSRQYLLSCIYFDIGDFESDASLMPVAFWNSHSNFGLFAIGINLITTDDRLKKFAMGASSDSFVNAQCVYRCTLVRCSPENDHRFTRSWVSLSGIIQS
jgi:hypothetical protein